MMSGTRKRKLMKIAAALLGVLPLATFVVPFLINVDRLRPKLESILGSALSREVHIGRLELSLLAGGMRAENLSIADDPAFSAARFSGVQIARYRCEPESACFLPHLARNLTGSRRTPCQPCAVCRRRRELLDHGPP